MTSTKKPIISKKSIEENQELKTIDELYRDLDREIKQRDESVERQKNSLVEQMYKEGENDFEEASKFRNERELYKYKLIAYMMSGFIAALGGLVLGARLGSGEVNAGGPYLMDAVAAAFIGFSVFGVGKPNAFGTLFGALLMGILLNGLIMMDFPYYSQDIVKGIVLISALSLTYYRRKN